MRSRGSGGGVSGGEDLGKGYSAGDNGGIRPGGDNRSIGGGDRREGDVSKSCSCGENGGDD